MSGRPVILSLCDLTGNFVQPWVAAGYDAVLVDPQHGESTSDGQVTRLAMTIEDAMPHLGNVIRSSRVAFVAGWPPCTDMAVSGARWFEAKRQADPMFQAKAVAVAEQCRTVGQLSGAPWLVENPDNRIHFASPGPERANFRSATPMGFARAVFAANGQAMEAVA